MSNPTRRIAIFHVLPVFSSTIIGGLAGFILFSSGVMEKVESPFLSGEDIQSTALNTMSFLMLVAAGSFFVLLLYKFRRILLHYLFAFSIFISGTGVYTVYLLALVGLGVIPRLNDIGITILSVLLSTALVISINRRMEALRILLLLTFGSLVGPLFAFMLPTWSSLAIVIALSIFDIYSVFKGPLSKMLPQAREGDARGELPGEFKWVTVSFKGVSLGIGDLIFYSMISALALIKPNVNILRWILTSLVLMAGAYVTLRLLEKRSVLPALPIPALGSITLYLLLIQAGV